MPVTLVMLPSQTSTIRAWASRLAAALPELSVVVVDDLAQAANVVGPRAGLTHRAAGRYDFARLQRRSESWKRSAPGAPAVRPEEGGLSW